MSVKVTSRVWATHITPLSKKAALLLLADHGNDHGESIYAGMETLAWELCVTPKQAREHVHALSRTGS